MCSLQDEWSYLPPNSALFQEYPQPHGCGYSCVGGNSVVSLHIVFTRLPFSAPAAFPCKYSPKNSQENSQRAAPLSNLTNCIFSPLAQLRFIPRISTTTRLWIFLSGRKPRCVFTYRFYRPPFTVPYTPTALLFRRKRLQVRGARA